MTAIVVTPLALLGGVFYAAGTLGRAVVDAHLARPHLLPRRRHAFRYHGLQRERVGVSLAVAALAAIATFATVATIVACGWRLQT